VLSEDGSRLAAAGDDGFVYVLRTGDGQLLWRQPCGGVPVRGLAISPDGSRIATGVGPGSPMLLWEGATGQLLRRFSKIDCWCCEFTRDGTRILAGGAGEIDLWDVATGNRLGYWTKKPNIECLALAPDGKRFATGSYDGSVRVWAFGREQPLITFDAHHEIALWVAFAPDGSHLATSGKDGAVRLWRLPAWTSTPSELPPGLLPLVVSPRPLWQPLSEIRRDAIPPSAKDGSARSADVTAFSHDGEFYAVGGEDGHVRVRSTAGGKPVRDFDCAHAVREIAFTRENTLLTVSRDNAIREWSLATGKEGRRFTFPPMQRAHFSADGKRVSSGGAGGIARVWDVTAEKELLRAAFDLPVACTLSADGKLLAMRLGTNLSAGATLLEVWGVDDGKPLARREWPQGWILGQAFLPDGTLFVVGKGRLAWFDPTTMREVRSQPFSPESEHVAWGVSPDGRLLAHTNGAEMAVRLLDLQRGAQVASLALPVPPQGSFSFSPDGRFLVCGGFKRFTFLLRVDEPTGELAMVRKFTGQRGPRTVAVSPDRNWAYSSGYDNTTRVWDLTAGREARRIADGAEPYDSLALSDDGKQLLQSHRQSMARLWDAASGKELQVFRGSTEFIGAVALSGDGRRALTGGHDKLVRLWDTATGREIQRLRGHMTAVRAVAFLGGNLAVSGGHDRTVIVWNLNTGSAVKRFGPTESWIFRLAVHPDGKRIAVPSGSAALVFDSDSGQVLHQFRGHPSDLYAVAFSPDGKMLATGGFEKAVRVWELETGRCVAIGRGHTEHVASVAFAGNRRVISAGDNTVRVWELPRPVAPAPRPAAAKEVLPGPQPDPG
jgi:WD40 repeat protein